MKKLKKERFAPLEAMDAPWSKEEIDKLRHLMHRANTINGLAYEMQRPMLSTLVQALKIVHYPETSTEQ